MTTNSLARVIRALAALATVVALAVGPPVALMRLGPIPTPSS